MQPGQHLPGRPRPEVDQAGRAPPATRRAPCTHRVGDGAGAYRLTVVDAALERGAGDRGTQADLGRDLATVAAQRPVPHRGVDRVAGRGQRGPDVGEVEQRRQRVGDGHASTVSGGLASDGWAGAPGCRRADSTRRTARCAPARRATGAARRATAGRDWSSPRRARCGGTNAHYRGLEPHPHGRGAALMSETLENLLQETRQFPPPAALAAQANVTAGGVRRGRRRPARLLGRAGRAGLTWAKPWDEVLDWSNPPFAKWFVGGELNVAYNCVDRHVEAGLGDRVAIHWEGEPGDTRTITYADLLTERQPGGEHADRPRRDRRRPGRDLPADDPRGGGRDAGLRPDRRHAQRGLRRVQRRRARHPDPGRRRQAGDHRRRRLPPRQAVARSSRPSTRPSRSARASSKVLVVRRTGEDVAWTDKDVWWHESVEQASDKHDAQPFDAEHPLFILYTSGTTGEAQGHPAHHRRLPDPDVVHPPRGLRPQAGDRRLLVHRRHRLGHRALATSCTVRSPTAPPR